MKLQLHVSFHFISVLAEQKDNPVNKYLPQSTTTARALKTYIQQQGRALK
jgi:hypothetical protein